MDVSFRNQHSVVTYSQNFGLIRISIVTITHYIKEVLCSEFWRAVFITCSFREMVAILINLSCRISRVRRQDGLYYRVGLFVL